MSKKQNKPRKITVVFEIDWDDYDDVCNELIIDDVLDNHPMKDGVTYSVIEPLKTIK